MQKETFSSSTNVNPSQRQVYLEDIPYEIAREKLLRAFQGTLMAGETRPVVECLGRVTASPVFATVSSPHYHAAAVDGVAVDAAVTFEARETAPVILTVGENAFWVDTGDPLPPGTNAVIMVEDLADKGAGKLEIVSAVAPWENVRIYGEDMVETELILPANHKLRPVDIAAVLAGGVTETSVRRQPLVTFIPTGSELVPPGARPAPGQIIEFNSAMISGMVREWGGIPKVTPIVPDDFHAILEAVKRALSESDLVLIGAGSSAGSEDYTFRVLDELGEVFLHGIATRPGKPVVLGRASGKPVIGVPGYPVSAALDMELFVKPLLHRFLGLPSPPPDTVTATLSRNVVSPMGVDEFVRVKLGKVGKKLVATPLVRGAALTTSLVRADGILVVPRGREGFMGGREVEVQLVRPLWEILGTVVHIGSHDPILDIIANLLREMRPEMTFSSANQGSFGGLLALRRGECHMAGTHLLDEETGTYNVPYLQRYLPNMDVVLVTLVYRQQGLIVRPGNPKNIRDIQDLTRPEVTFVNRQKGAGTRVLLDLALKEKGISPSLIRGYDREEYTHTQVAAAVKSGAADAGLGIMAAARALGLDFIPWREERYDLAILSEYLDHPGVRAILEIIRSDCFKEQAESMGGYSTRDTGRVIWTSRAEGYR